jgi:hypothetical protein
MQQNFDQKAYTGLFVSTEVTVSCSVLCGDFNSLGHLEDLGADLGIILKCILNKFVWRV